MPDDSGSNNAATPRPDRLSSALVATLSERGPSAATVELHDAVIERVRQMRDDGFSAGRAVSTLREIVRGTLESRATSSPLERCLHTIIGDVTRWCLNEYFRPRRDSPGTGRPGVGVTG